MQKNVSGQKLIVFAFNSTTNAPVTGDAGNITAYVSKDYGTVTVLGDTSATEMDATNAKGYYLFDLTQAETNADTLLFSAKSVTASVVVIGVPATVFTTPPNFDLLSIDSSGRMDLGKILGTTSVGAVGYVGVDWGQVTNKTTTNALTGTTIATTQKVDVDTIKTNPVANAGTITFPTNATVASAASLATAQTGITTLLVGVNLNANQHVITDSGTVTTVTNQLTQAQIATGVWTDTTASDFTVTSSIGKSLFTGRAPGDTLGGLLANNNSVSVSALAVNGSTTLNTLTVTSTTTLVGAVTASNAGNNIVGVHVTGTADSNVISVNGNTFSGANVPANAVLFDGNSPVQTLGKLWVLDGSGNAVAPAATALSNAVWLDALAGFLPNLNVGGAVASHADALTLASGILAVQTDTDDIQTRLPAALVGGKMDSTATVTGNVTLDVTQAVPTSNTANTVGDCLNAARAQGFGKWAIVGTTLSLYAPDNVTVVHSFTLNSATAPTSRT